MIGPSGCGKSTVLRCLNRMHEEITGAYATGTVKLDDTDIYGSGIDVVAVRRSIGMVFQKPNPFPTMSVGDNVAAGLRLAGVKGKHKDEVVEKSLRDAGLWEEVKDRLSEPGDRPLRRPAAAPVHRAHDRDPARHHPHGRALLGAGPDRDAEDRGAHPRAQARLHDHHRDPQHAAGGARGRPHGVLLARRADRAGRRPRRSSPSPTISAPRTTSPASSGRGTGMPATRHAFHEELEQPREPGAGRAGHDRGDARARARGAQAPGRRAGPDRHRRRRSHRRALPRGAPGHPHPARHPGPGRDRPAHGRRAAARDQARRAHGRPVREHRQAHPASPATSRRWTRRCSPP